MVKKYQTTFKIKAEKKPSSITELLENLFYKRPALADHALNLLKQIKKGNFETRHWKEFCKKEFQDCKDEKGKVVLDKARVQYYSIIRKLRGAGIIYQRDNLYYLSTHFEEYLKWSAEMIENWKKE